MLKILQSRLQQYVYEKLSDVQTGFRKGQVLPISKLKKKKCVYLST